MHPHRPLRLRPAPLTRWLAAAFAAVVFAVGLLAFAPEAHAELHDHAHETEHSCAITLLAHGVTTPVAIIWPQPEVRLVAPQPLAPDTPQARPPRFLHKLGRAPPRR